MLITASSLVRSATRRMVPPGGLNLAALFRTLRNICAVRTRSASRYTGFEGSVTINSFPELSISLWLVSIAISTACRSGKRSFRSLIFPCVIRDTSSRSSTRWTI